MRSASPATFVPDRNGRKFLVHGFGDSRLGENVGFVILMNV
jgi:hypothetical protein